MDKVYTPEEVAEQLRVTAYTVRRWLKNGELRAIKLESFWRIPESALQDFVNARTTGDTAASAHSGRRCSRPTGK